MSLLGIFKGCEEVLSDIAFYLLTYYLRLGWVFVAAQAFSSCDKRGLLFVAVHGLLIEVASLAAEHGL